MKRRVVITGLGAITPVGNNVNDFWNSIKEGRNGIDVITHFDTSDFKVKLAAEVKDFKAENYMDRKQAKRMDRSSQFAIAATKEALLDSKLDLENYDKERISIIFGSGIGGIETIQNQIRILDTKGPNRISPLTIPMAISNIAAGNMAIEFGIKGLCFTLFGNTGLVSVLERRVRVLEVSLSLTGSIEFFDNKLTHKFILLVEDFEQNDWLDPILSILDVDASSLLIDIFAFSSFDIYFLI